MFRNEQAFIRTTGIDQNPILNGALNGNRSVVEVLSGTRGLQRSQFGSSAGGWACIIHVAVVRKQFIGRRAGGLGWPSIILRLIEIGRVLAKGIRVVFVRGAVRENDSKANLGEAGLAVVGRRHV